MEGASLEELLSHILNPDNVLRKRAEKELEHRSSAVPGFCASLADYCTQVVSQNVQLRLAEVAFAVLKRGIAQSVDSQEVQYIVSLFLTHLGNVAVVHGVSVTTLLQWTSVVATGVRRLAVLRGSTAAVQDDAAALAAACFEAAANMATSQLLNAFALFAQADDAALRVVCSHLYLLQTFFEGSVANVLHEWCGEVVASCAAPLLEMLCASAAGAMATAASQATAPAFSPAELQMRCALQSLVAETLVLLYEWQFAASRRGKFPADLKRAFLESFATLQACVLMPCAQWVSAMAPASSAANVWEQRRALARVSPLLAAALSTQRLVVKVLQYGGWYKRCATPELLEGLLSSLEADVGCNTLALAMDDEDASAGGWAGAGPSGTLADGWVALGTTRSAEYPEEGAALVVRSHVTQRWTLFRDIAFLPTLRRTLTNIVDDQRGRRYFQLLLSYAALSPSEAAAQMESPNTFLRNEGDREDGVRWTARDTVAQLYTESITAIGPVVLHAAMEDLSQRLSPESGSSESSSTSGLSPLQQTLQLEAPLFFMEAALRHSAKQVRACSAAIPAHLAQHIWTCYVTGPSTTHPVTATRAVMLVAAMTEFACAAPSRRAAGPSAAAPAASSFDAVLAIAVAESAAMLSTFTGRTAAAGASASPCPLLVAVVLCQFLQRTLPYWPPHVLAQHFCALQEAFLLLLSPQAGLYEEALYGVVEQLTDLLHAARRCDAGAAAAAVPLVAEGLPATVMACWRCHVSDPSFADVMLQLLRLVVRDRSGTSASPALSRLLEELSWVNKVLCGYADSMAEVCAVPYFLRLLRSLFAHATDDVANAAAALMLDSLCQLLLCTEESAILVASSSCLAALLRRCPSANTVQVHVVAATVEAALSGTAMTSASSSSEANGELIAHAPRTAYPFSAVIVAIVLRTLQDDRGEASLMEMGQTLTTIMHHSTSFTEADLIRVIHATVHRLGGVRTDTVREQLLAPLATLLRLHPAALLHTLVQCGLMAETMVQWLPRLEHFTSVGVTYASCAGLLGLLQLLSQPTGASLTAEEGQRVAQQTVVCRWRLPEGVAGNGGRGAKRGAGKKGASSRKALDAILFGGAVVETSLPLYAAILIAVGRGVLTLLAAPLPALRRAARSGSAEDVGAGAAGGGDAGSSSDDDDREGEGGRRLFQESSDDGEEEEWEEEVEDFDDDDEDEDGAAAPLTRPVRGEDENAQDEANVTRAAAERRQLLAAMGTDLLPWMQQHGAEVMPYFTAEETQLLTSFFAAAAGGTGSA